MYTASQASMRSSIQYMNIALITLLSIYLSPANYLFLYRRRALKVLMTQRWSALFADCGNVVRLEE